MSKGLDKLLAMPRWVPLLVGAALYAAAFALSLPRWIGVLIAALVGAIYIAYDRLDRNAKLPEAERRARNRNLAVALALAFLVALFYAATIVRLGPNALNRPM